jgi:hypothetical protein
MERPDDRQLVFKASASDLFRIETLRLTKIDIQGFRVQAAFMFRNIRELCLTMCKERVLDDCAITFEKFKQIQQTDSNSLHSLIISTEVYESEEENPDAYLGFREQEAASAMSHSNEFIPFKYLFDLFEKFKLREFRVNMCEILSYGGSIDNRSLCGPGWMNLEELYLSKCRIRRIEANAFSNLKRLKELDLNSNEIEFIDRQAFKGLGNLAQLVLWKNKLHRIEHGTFDSLISLKELNLRSNQIEELTTGLFDSLGSLVELNLEFNVIRRLDEDVFKGLTKLHYLELIGNPISESLSEHSAVFTTYLRNIKYVNLEEEF